MVATASNLAPFFVAWPTLDERPTLFPLTLFCTEAAMYVTTVWRAHVYCWGPVDVALLISAVEMPLYLYGLYFLPFSTGYFR